MKKITPCFLFACLILNWPGAAKAVDRTGMIPLNDLGAQKYKSFEGGLYENGKNEVPADHDAFGKSQAKAVQPLDANGNPSPNGSIVLLSLGMSNTTMEFRGTFGRNAPGGSRLPPSASFMGQAAADPAVDHSHVVLVDGAAGAQVAARWDPLGPMGYKNYDRVRDEMLTPASLSEKQVQVIWLKEADPRPQFSLPSPDADAYQLETHLSNIMRAVKQRYPNIKMVFLSSRIYAGYAINPLNPEPYAYESGFAIKWLIQAQIDQMRHGGAAQDLHAGDLNYKTTAPWIAWGPYLWADGTQPRSDGLVWLYDDFSQKDRTHPAPSGVQKVGGMLLQFFKTSPYTTWFRRSL